MQWRLNFSFRTYLLLRLLLASNRMLMLYICKHVYTIILLKEIMIHLNSQTYQSWINFPTSPMLM